MLLHVPIDHVVGNVDFSIGVPAGEFRFRIVQNLSREFKPTDFLGVLLPVSFPFGLGIGPLGANLVWIFGIVLHLRVFYFKGLM